MRSLFSVAVLFIGLAFSPTAQAHHSHDVIGSSTPGCGAIYCAPAGGFGYSYRPYYYPSYQPYRRFSMGIAFGYGFSFGYGASISLGNGYRLQQIYPPTSYLPYGPVNVIYY